MKILIPICSILIATLASPAFAGNTGRFDPRQTFAPMVFPQSVNRYRSGSGAPGPDYWQNRADYEIHANIDTGTHVLSATETITYTNNSPDTLNSLWLQLDQNIYRKDSRASRASNRVRKGATDGYQLDSVQTNATRRFADAKYLVDDTRMQIRLAKPLEPGKRIKVRIVYHYELPGEFGGRTAWVKTTNGVIYDVAQWFPRMAVYDDLRGWDTLPYIGSEFYLEYGDIDYYVTLPSDMLVAGSGELINPRDVLTREQRDRLDQAAHSDKTVIIRGANEINSPDSRPRQDGTLTWHFRMQDTRDVAFSASKAFIWDAARANLPDNRTTMIMSFYPVESDGDGAWGRSTEYMKHAVETFSKRWASYPYPAAINVAGKVGGMEYPGIVFDSMKTKGKTLFWLSAHEIGHTWFPMMVGTNERRDAWMDEGLNTFIDVYESDDFDGGVYGPKRDSEYAPGGGNPVEDIQGLLADANAPVIMSRPETISEKYRHPVSYFKTALGLVLLREQILGPRRFDWAYRKFIHDWSFRHPSPSDFFRTMESSAGEDLGWFWRGWFMNNWQLDLAVTDVKPAAGEDAGTQGQGTDITIANLDRQVMPVSVEIDFANGTSRRIRLPVETWLQHTTRTIHIEQGLSVSRVIVDPDAQVPDADRSNNTWPAPSSDQGR